MVKNWKNGSHKAQCVSVTNNTNDSKILSGNLSTVKSDLKIFTRLFNCKAAVSAEIVPGVHGNNFSPPSFPQQ
jgi:hypothetical protein